MRNREYRTLIQHSLKSEFRIPYSAFMVPPQSESPAGIFSFHPIWSHALANPPRGLAYAREKGWVLTWDGQDWLYLLNRNGERQSQLHAPGKLAAAACADDGSGYGAAGAKGEIWWLTPDLRVRWEQSVGHPVTAVAMDSLGHYLAVADSGGTISIFDCQGRSIAQSHSTRPLHHLTFMPSSPYLLGASDYGLVTCFDLKGNLRWRDGLVAHIGSLTVSGLKACIVVLACFTEGLQKYDGEGKNLGRQSMSEACRLAALTFDASHLLVAGMSNRLLWLNGDHRILSTHSLEKSAVAIGLSPLGDRMVAALANGSLVGLDLRKSPSP
jgi:hypothetical protein